MLRSIFFFRNEGGNILTLVHTVDRHGVGGEKVEVNYINNFNYVNALGMAFTRVQRLYSGMKKIEYILIVFVLGALVILVLLIPQTAVSPVTYSSSPISSSFAPTSDVTAHVIHAVDGDTLLVEMTDGNEEYVRLIGIDTPETVDERKKVQCYGPEASARMKELVEGKSVVLETKPDEDRDDYGRLLRYVFLDGKDIGAMMLKEGYARSLCAAFPHPRCEQYEELEKEAVSAGRGRWGRCQ